MTHKNQSNQHRNNTWPYQLVLWMAALPILAYTLWLAVRYRQFRYLQQRLGFGYPIAPHTAIWLHAASVGEVLAAEPLLTALHRQYPKLTLVVSTVTPTGAQIVHQRLGDQAIHVYLPIDWRRAARRLLHTLRPRCALIMETELWPNLYQACARQGIPLLVVNARLSSKTLNTRGWIRALYRVTLQQVTAILARSPADAEGFRELGAAPDKVQVLGNIKFSAAQPATGIKPITLPRAFVLAASTHEDEELQLARLWLALQPRHELLVIAPRHPNRRHGIIKQLDSLSVKLAVRSRNDNVQVDTQIYLADTLGELTSFMASAELVVMGGSFVPVGGHNLLEPARLGKAILFGPSMHNFTEETDGLLAQQAALQVDNYEQLGHELTALLQDHARRRALEQRAQQFMQRNSDVLPRYLSAIKRYCQLPDE